MSGRSMQLDVLVRLRDHLSGPLRGLRNNLANIANFGRRIGLLGAAIGALSFMGPLNEAAAFQQQLINIAGTAELTGKAAFKFVDEAQRQYEDLAFMIGQNSQTIAEGAGQMIAAGVNRNLIDATIEDIGRAATAADASFSDMSSVGVAMISNLKLPADQMRDSLGALVIAGKEGAFELKDMAASFPSLTSGVAKFGVKGREAVNFLASALQIARKGTADPASAANNLNNFLGKALNPLTKKNFEELGVNIEGVMLDAVAKGMNPIEAVIQKVGKLTGVQESAITKYMEAAKKRGLEGAEALGFVREQLEAIGAAGKIGELFQDKQVLDFLIPFLANVDEYRDIKNKVAAATGAAIDGDFETQMEGINRQLTIFGEVGTQAKRFSGMAFGEWLPVINPLLISALKWVRELDASTGGLVRQFMTGVGGALLLVTAMGALGVVLPIVGAGLGAVGAFAALILSPIGLLIGALAAGGAFIWKNWDRYGSRVMRLWDRAKKAFGDLASYLGDRGQRIVTAGRALFERYAPVIANAILRGLSGALAIAERYGPKIAAAIDGAWKGLVTLGQTDAAKQFLEGIKTAFDNAGTAADWLARNVAEVLKQFSEMEGSLKPVIDFMNSNFGADFGNVAGQIAGYGIMIGIAAIGISAVAGSLMAIGRALIFLSGIKLAWGIVKFIGGLAGFGAAGAAGASATTTAGVVGAGAGLAATFKKYGLIVGGLLGLTGLIAKSPEYIRPAREVAPNTPEDYLNRFRTWNQSETKPGSFVRAPREVAPNTPEDYLNRLRDWIKGDEVKIEPVLDASLLEGPVRELSGKMKDDLSVTAAPVIDTGSIDAATMKASNLSAIIKAINGSTITIPTGDWRAPAYEPPRTKGGVSDVRPLPSGPERTSFSPASSSKFAAISGASRQDVNVGGTVRIAVDGPGRVTSTTSDNSKVAVAVDRGRMVGRV